MLLPSYFVFIVYQQERLDQLHRLWELLLSKLRKKGLKWLVYYIYMYIIGTIGRVTQTMGATAVQVTVVYYIYMYITGTPGRVTQTMGVVAIQAAGEGSEVEAGAAPGTVYEGVR